MLTLSQMLHCLDIMFYKHSLHSDTGVVVVVTLMCVSGKWVICATVQTPSDQSDDEHLYDHQLLT